MKPDQLTLLRNALEECKEIFAIQAKPCRVDPDYGAEVEELGDSIGYGALMSSASASWEKRLVERHGITGGARGVSVGRIWSETALIMVEEALKVLSSLTPRKASKARGEEQVTTDIKATVAELERILQRPDMRACTDPQVHFDLDEYGGARSWHEDDKDSEPMSFKRLTKLFTEMREVVKSTPALLAELHRLWAKEARQQAIEDAAMRYRDAYSKLMDGDGNHMKLVMSRQDARIALFAALDAKSAVGEQAERGGEAGK